MGLLISFEGGDGSGKSTQASLLLERLQRGAYDASLIHEPGSTLLGARLRELVKGRELITPVAELALFAAARAELVEKTIKPWLQQGWIIITDWYLDSTVAYQGYGRRLPLETISILNTLVTQGIKPQRTFLLDLDPKDGLQRTLPKHQGRGDEEGQRRFEEEPLAFHRRVRRGYLDMAKAEPNRFIVLDATRPEEELEKAIWQNVSLLLSKAQCQPNTSTESNPGGSEKDLLRPVDTSSKNHA